MQDLCNSINCRRSELLNYFGEKFKQVVCKNCDNCLDEVNVVDGTVIAQKILSCVSRMNQNFGAQMVVDVLKGSKNQKVLSWGFDKLTTHGLLQEYSEKEIRHYIETLIMMGFLRRSEGEYPVIQWTERSRAVIKGEEVVKFKKRTFRESKKVETLTKDKDKALFETLRQLRLDLSREEGVPPYVVFSDRTLMEMAKRQPLTQEQMLDINGVGPHKWRKYGEQFLKIILENSPKKSGAKIQKPRSEEITFNLFKVGKSLDEICELRSLTRATVADHLVAMMNEGVKPELERLVSAERQKSILSALDKAGTSKCKPIKETLPEDFSYEEIRLVLASIQPETKGD
jgi:ATP-dependent DNA helicase RecQ